VTDELHERLRRIDPAPPEVPVDPITSPRARALLEDVMSQTVESTGAEPAPVEPTRGRNRFLIAGAAAAAVVAIAVVAVVAAGGEDETAPEPVAAPLTLAAPGGDPSMSMCLAFDVNLLAESPVAFGGTVTAVSDADVTLDVDHWYKGGDAATVVVESPVGGQIVALDGVEFVEGDRYLVSATDGTVNICGFSGPATTELEAAFAEAFPPAG
jgi:hypothetical protein